VPGIMPPACTVHRCSFGRAVPIRSMDTYSRHSFATNRPRARRRARARMAQLGLMNSRAPEIVQDQNARAVWEA
jgi:hypothetical protein